MATSYLNAYRTPLETATSAEIAVELCDAALLRLRPGAAPHQLAEAEQAVCALVTMVNPDAGEVAANLLRLYEYCLHRMGTPGDDLQSVRATLGTLRSAFAGLTD
jgi:hypothetical protein